ncbi:MAG TPA: aminotransferase class III-fold pyridoxal phosphate-dependent enzyme, partial [Thermoanaerobaculia bacterium]|nr:aminotransferase class III-fold pyridoxal phosphate-dependent enzyme [Thermoanaerobaculia bacterium]
HRTLRSLCTRHGALLVFDEVMTGFRVGAQGAQGIFGITPDLTTLGKVIGGGLPVAAYGGRRDLMSQVAPDGPVYQAGTLSGNPLAMAAGIAMLREIERRPPYKEIERKGALLEASLRQAIHDAGADDVTTYQRVGSLSTLFFTGGGVTDFSSARRSDTRRYAAFFHAMRKRGVFLPPAQYEAWFVSTAHSDADLRRTARAAGESLREASGGNP